MLASEKLTIARKIFQTECENLILDSKSDFSLRRIRFSLKNGIIIYIQYNNHEEYSYLILFSQIEQDLCRFDNYDDNWSVETKPHHIHPRHKIDAIKNPMNGDPNQDIPRLCEYLKNGKILSENFE